MKKLVIIPARAGSKAIPGKNWKKLDGKPLVQYTIEIALKQFSEDEICISTDSIEVIEIAKELGLKVPFIRPSELANDFVGTQEVLLHALQYWQQNFFDPDVIILLQPTSPFRKSIHVTEALSLYNSSVDMVLGVKHTNANPYYNLKEEDVNGFLRPSKSASFIRRQDCPNVYEVNGAIYIINPNSLSNLSIQSFTKVVKYVMDNQSSFDIDDEFDWILAECIIKNELNLRSLV